MNNDLQRLKSRQPLKSRLKECITDNPQIKSPDHWAVSKWKEAWKANDSHLKQFIQVPTPQPPGHDLKRSHWVLLNRLRSGHGRYASFMKRIGVSESDLCVCGDVQTSQHVLSCATFDIRGTIETVDDEFRDWLNKNSVLIL